MNELTLNVLQENPIFIRANSNTGNVNVYLYSSCCDESLTEYSRVARIWGEKRGYTSKSSFVVGNDKLINGFNIFGYAKTFDELKLKYPEYFI